MSTTTSHRPPPKPLDLELTIISAKHLKNVNWRNGDLTPYAIFWLDPNHRLTTKPDHSNSTKPIWNELFHIPIPSSPSPSILTLEIFHSIPSDTPKPLVGTLRLPIHDLPNPQHNNINNNNNNTVVRTFDLRRPSGRVQGKIRLKLALRDRVLPDYQITHQPAYYYNTATPPSYGLYPPSPSPYITVPPPPTPPQPQSRPRPYHYGPYSDPYSGYYNGGYYPQPQATTRGNEERLGHGDGGGLGGVGGPSAPVEYGQYEQKQETGKVESGAGLGAAMASSVRQSGYGDGGGVSGPSAPVDYVQYEQKHKTGNVASGVGLGMEVGVTAPRPSPSGYGDAGGVGGPTAPVSYAHYEQKQKTGLGVGGVTVNEGPRYHDEERVESDVNARELDDYSGYRRVDY